MPDSDPTPEPANGDEPVPSGSPLPATGDGAAEPGLPAAEGELDRALALVRFLRARCPWDAAQTPRSLLPHLIEECHEVVDAVRAGDDGALEGELGDLLLNLAFQVVLGEEADSFDAGSVADVLEEKMKRRHPRIFGRGEAAAAQPGPHREGWERMKAREREEGSVLDGLPEGLDPLLRAHRIQDRASGVGFDWAEPLGAWKKVAEELEEVREALEGDTALESDTAKAPAAAALEEELGDLLFSVVNLVRLAGSHASTALDAANRKFTRRFERLEERAADRGIDLNEASLETLDALWDELKGEEER